MFFEYEYYDYIFTISYIKEDLIKQFTDIIYDKLGLILDIEETKKTISNKNEFYDLVFKVELFDNKIEYTYRTRLTNKEKDISLLIDSICYNYYNRIDDQGNVEFTPISELEPKLKCDSYNTALTMINNLKNNLCDGLIRYV